MHKAFCRAREQVECGVNHSISSQLIQVLICGFILQHSINSLGETSGVVIIEVTSGITAQTLWLFESPNTSSLFLVQQSY